MMLTMVSFGSLAAARPAGGEAGPVSEIRLEGVATEDEGPLRQALRQALTGENGLWFETDEASILRQAVRRFYRRRGIIYADLTSLDWQAGSLTLRVFRRPIDKIIYRGNLATPELAARLGLVAGKPFNLFDTEKAGRELRSSRQWRKFRALEITPFIHPREDKLTIGLTARSRGRLELRVRGWNHERVYSGIELAGRIPSLVSTRNDLTVGARDYPLAGLARHSVGWLEFSDIRQKSEPNPVRYRAGVRAGWQDNTGGTFFDRDQPGERTTDRGASIGSFWWEVNTGLYFWQGGESWRRFSRWVGFGGAPLLSGVWVDYTPGTRSRTGLELNLSDNDVRASANQVSIFKVRVGYNFSGEKAVTGQDSSLLWGWYQEYSLDYAAPLDPWQHFRFQTGWYDNPQPASLEEREEPLAYISLLPAGSRVGSRMFLAGLRWEYGWWDRLFFAGPAVEFRLVARNRTPVDFQNGSGPVFDPAADTKKNGWWSAGLVFGKKGPVWDWGLNLVMSGPAGKNNDANWGAGLKTWLNYQF